MPAIPCSLRILDPRFNSCLKPLFLSLTHLSHSSPRKFLIPTRIIPPNPRTLSSVAPAFVPPSVDNGGGGGRSGALSAPPISEEFQKIDVNPPKGTRDFPPEDMRFRNWLFNHFKELYCFEDRGNQRVALRPELTPSLARMVIQKGELGITASDVGFKVSSRKVLQELLRSYSVPENLFGKVCIIIDKVLVQIANGTEPMEAVITIDVLRRVGVDVTVASVEKQLRVDACYGVKIVADSLISDCSDTVFDLITLPKLGMNL